MKKMLLFMFIICMNFVQAQVANSASDLSVCDDDFDGIFCFNLTIQNAQILGSQNPANYTITYHATQADADNGMNLLNPNSYCNTASAEIIYARLEDNANNFLFDTTSFQISVAVPPFLQQLTPLALCDDDFDELAIFDLTSREAEMIGAQTGITFQYYASNLDLINDIPITNPTAYQNNANPQTIFVRATNFNNCESDISFTIRVLPIPTPTPNPTPIEVCDDDNDGIAIIDITVRETEILNGEAGVTVSYHTSQTDAELDQNFIANPFAYSVDMANANMNGQVIVYVRVESDFQIGSDNQPCYVVVELPVVVNSQPILTNTSFTYVFCEFDSDNIGQFNWDEVTAVLNLLQAPQDINDYTVTYHQTIGGAINNTGALSNGYENTTDPQTVFIRVTNTTTGCFNVNNIPFLQLLVEPSPSAITPPVYEVCADDASNQTATFDLSTLDASIIGGQSNVQVLYYGNATDAMNTMNALTPIYVSSSQQIVARTQNIFTGCYSDPVTVTLQVNPLPVVTLPADTAVCVDNSGFLLTPFSIGTDLGSGFIYFWNTPSGMSTTPTVTVTEAGTYSLLVTDANSSTSCGYSDSVTFTGDFPPCSLSVPETSANSVTIYPNPVTDELIVQSETNLQIENLAIYSLEGRRILEQTTDFDQEEIRVNVTEFAAGFYILKLRTIDNEFITKRFIVK